MMRNSLHPAGSSMRRSTFLTAAFAITIVLAASSALAQEPGGEGSSPSVAEGSAASNGYSVEELSEQGFRPAESTRPGDTVAGGPLLVAAYALFWGMVVTYVGMLIRRQSATTRALQQLSSRLNDIDDRLQSAEARNRKS